VHAALGAPIIAGGRALLHFTKVVGHGQSYAQQLALLPVQQPGIRSRTGCKPSTHSLISRGQGGKGCRCGKRQGKLVIVVSHDRQAAPDLPRRLDVRIPATLEAAAMARRALSKLALPLPLAFDAQVAVSELVTNSVRHAGLSPDDLIQVSADWSGTRLRVHVRDGGRGGRPPTVSGSIRPAPGAESGWGLYLVDRVASRWGTSASGYWFELHQQPPHPGG
jgi:anti-sigma regulatory factor (Ser/Thr protein kinase)